MDELFDYDIKTPPGGQPPNFQLFINPTTPLQSPLPSPFPPLINNNVNKNTTPNLKKRRIDDIEEEGMDLLSPSNEELDAIFNNFLSDTDTDNLVKAPTQQNFLQFIPTPSPTNEDPTDTLTAQKLKSIADIIDRMNAEIDVIKHEQKTMPTPIQYAQFERLHKEQIQLIQNCELAKEELKQLLANVTISPTLLTQLFNLQQELSIIHFKLQLFQEELQAIYSAASSSKCFACLVIVKSPFPKSVKQHTKSTSIAVEDPTIIQLLCAPRTEVHPLSKVRAGLVFEDYQSKRGSFTILNDQQELDESGFAKFSDLRFPQGTRLKMVRLQFTMDAQFCSINGSVSKALIETKEPSNAFVVMTNENQWDQSEGMLLRKDIFDGNLDASWSMFANTLQIHYLRSTRQEPAEPRRPLTKFDFQYIKQNLFNDSDVILQKDFEKFWNWFGKVLHRIRHQKPFLYLWLNGLVYGFITKADVEYLLKGQNVGTFIIRFSERKAGKVAIAFNKFDLSEGKIVCKHFLCDAIESGINAKTLPDFLRTNDNFTHLIKLKTSFNCSSYESFIEIIHKDVALREYYTKTNTNSVDGYLGEEDL